jgi:hypothetical protein
VALEILENLGVRSFESVLDFSDTDYSSNFSSDLEFTVGYDFIDGLQNWIKSPSNAINTEIETNGTYTWLNFAQYGYNGGRLTREYPEILFTAHVQMYQPSFVSTGLSDEVGVRFRAAGESETESAIKVVIDQGSIEVFEFSASIYTSILTVDTSLTTAADVGIAYDKALGNVSVIVNGTPSIAVLSITPNIHVIELFTANYNDYPLEMQISYVDAFGSQFRNLNLVISPQLTTEYVAGDILIVSSHEGSDYGGDSIAPRVSAQFVPISTTIDLSTSGESFQRFWARTLTASEPLLYQFTRGDSESYYDTPTCVGFIVRGGLLEDLTAVFADVAIGTNAAATTISSNSSGAVQGDLVYGFAYNQAYTIIPSTDLLWYEPYPYGVSSLREATVGDDGIVRFVAPPAPYDYQVFAARISSSENFNYTQPVIIDPIETIRPPATYPNTNITIPPSANGAAPQTLTTSAAPIEDLAADVLRGFDNLGYAMQRPKRLSGVAKLEDDIWRITSRILLQTSLRTRLVASEQGLLAARIKRELENPVNWWAGQETPIVLQKIVITRRDIARIGGIALQADADGDLAVFVNYLERSTGIEVQRDGLSALTIPFGAFDGGN